jgi:predicted site-specific integrase-resolvase
MPRHPNPRAIRTARTYTIVEAAESLGVSFGTVRGWIRAGLPAMTAQRPFLILGEHLRGFLVDRRVKRRASMGRDQLYCLT